MLRDSEIPKETKRVRIKGTFSYEMEVDITENPISLNSAHTGYRTDFETLRDAKVYICESMYDQIESDVLGESDFGGLVDFEVEEI